MRSSLIFRARMFMDRKARFAETRKLLREFVRCWIANSVALRYWVVVL
jgi:hypothetical protein